MEGGIWTAAGMTSQQGTETNFCLLLPRFLFRRDLREKLEPTNSRERMDSQAGNGCLFLWPHGFRDDRGRGLGWGAGCRCQVADWGAQMTCLSVCLSLSE